MREKTHILANLCWVSKVIFQFDKKYIWVIGFSGVITGIGAPILTIISQEIINSIQKKEFIRNIFYAKKSRNFPCFFSIFGKIPYSLFFNLLYNRG